MSQDPSLKPCSALQRISPSRFHQFKKCKLRAYWESNNVRSLLPSSPSAHLGKIIHKIFEMASIGGMKGPDDFYSLWLKLIQEEENEMNRSWIERHLIPLEKSVPSYEVKKQQCLRSVIDLVSNLPCGPKEAPVFQRSKSSEVWLQIPDGTIGGYVDAIVPTESGESIVDFKTGSILDPNVNGPNPRVNEMYAQQLKLYAALYHSTYGTWPCSLILIGLDMVRHEIEFTSDECISILEEAKKFLRDINFLIQNESSDIDNALNLLSSPSLKNCRYCQYRPGCSSYWQERIVRPNDDWPKDIRGKLAEKIVLGNGLNLIKVISDDGDKVIVSGLHSNRHPKLNEIISKIEIYSLIRYKKDDNYKEGIYTTMY